MIWEQSVRLVGYSVVNQKLQRMALVKPLHCFLGIYSVFCLYIILFIYILVCLDLTSKQKEWNFVGTKKELCDKFFCVNAYDRQFYPQFKEVNNCLMVRTLILGFHEEAISFEVTITFFLENGKNFEIKDNVYPITEGKDTILETSMQCHLKKLTKYYDVNTREIKNQPKIDFCLKIISPKLDEIAKDQHFESGI